MELYFPDITCDHTDDSETVFLSGIPVFFRGRNRIWKMIDVHNIWVQTLPNALPLNVFYFIMGFFLMCFGICLANNCMLPIIPTDIFPRDLSEILKKKYKLIKTSFDLSCLTTTVILSLVILHRFYGIGIGTVFCAFLTGKTVSIIQKFVGEHIEFYRLTGKKRMMLGRNVRHA